MIRLTVICPESHIDNGSHLAGCLGRSADDMNSFFLVWQDNEGNRYGITSGFVSDGVLDAANKPLVTPLWDVNGIVDLDMATSAQSLIKWDLSDVANSITAHVGDDYLEFIASAGIFKIPVETE